ncbi:hypothetical protein, partial [Pseudomonas syringae]|uniref:hypothetical protein n=1 Tax=Pseudomonas syringae TaxID=317 RepID=UPI0010272201
WLSLFEHRYLSRLLRQRQAFQIGTVQLQIGGIKQALVIRNKGLIDSVAILRPVVRSGNQLSIRSMGTR